MMGCGRHVIPVSYDGAEARASCDASWASHGGRTRAHSRRARHVTDRWRHRMPVSQDGAEARWRHMTPRRRHKALASQDALWGAFDSFQDGRFSVM